MNADVRSMFLMTQAVLPGMLKAGKGAIVCTSSISAVAATPMEVLYDTTKGRCICSPARSRSSIATRASAATRPAPASSRPHGMREIEALTKYDVDASEAALKAQQGRMCEPEEVARAALFLLSDEESERHSAVPSIAASLPSRASVYPDDRGRFPARHSEPRL